MDDILVLKLKEGEGLPADRLAQLADGHWKVNASRVLNVRYVIVLVHMKVLADFELGDLITLERQTGRITNLGLVDAHNKTGLVGKKLNYKTANPATIKNLDDLRARSI